ncbi:MAG: hypothetical protein N4Q32_00960 [Neisseriaceae bacterium]|nr:hypothetical protein [Neisseriaceae bacterium]MCV2508992.1 hypothetical protein [Neisseriaceae bacterium]
MTLLVFFAITNTIKEKYINQPFFADAVFATPADAKHVIFNNQVDGVIIIFFMITTTIIVLYGIRSILLSLKSEQATSTEVPYEPFPEVELARIKKEGI